LSGGKRFSASGPVLGGCCAEREKAAMNTTQPVSDRSRTALLACPRRPRRAVLQAEAKGTRRHFMEGSPSRSIGRVGFALGIVCRTRPVVKQPDYEGGSRIPLVVKRNKRLSAAILCRISRFVSCVSRYEMRFRGGKRETNANL
jgi:hypothetical protein